MNKYLDIYEKNKEIDNIFLEKYGDTEDINNKNILELLVELGEFANETKVFKYWSIKKPKDVDVILEEAADVFLMILYFCHRLDMDLSKITINDFNEDPNITFIRLFDNCSELLGNMQESRLISIINDFLVLLKSLNYSENDFIRVCNNKIIINDERLHSNY